MATYSTNSPYYNTPIINNELSVLNTRYIPLDENDQTYIIAKEYEFRPDLLAYDLYDDPNLWWVFINRNPDLIKDPIFDFTAGTSIRLSPKNTIKNVQGL